MLGGADNPNGELLSYIIGADSRQLIAPSRRGVRKLTVKRGKGSLKKQVWTGTGTISKKKPLTNPWYRSARRFPGDC